jgi:uncharacterized membrane protein YkoI
MKRIMLLPLVAISASIGLADEDYGTARALVERGEILSLDQILAKAGQHLQGRILEIEVEQERGRYLYEIELLDNSGVVKELQIDAASGVLLKIERED